MTQLKTNWQDQAEHLAKGLIAIAKIAMPDSYFTTDSRVRRAKKILQLIKLIKKKG